MVNGHGGQSSYLISYQPVALAIVSNLGLRPGLSLSLSLSLSLGPLAADHVARAPWPPC